MNYLNHSNELWDCFEFHIAKVGNMLPKQVIQSDLAIIPDFLQK